MSMLLSNATEHAPSIATQQCHGRTDGRTDADVVPARVNLTGRIARRGAADSERFSVDSAAASRAESHPPRLPRVGELTEEAS